MASFNFDSVSTNRRRTQRSSRIVVRVALFITALLIVALLRAPLAGVISRVAAPFSGMRDAVSRMSGTLMAPFVSKQALVSDNDSLRAQLQQAQAHAADRDALYAQVMELRQTLGGSHAPQTVVVAGVVARPPQLPYDQLLIDAGSDSGVVAGDEVWAGGGSVVVGAVSEVFKTTARAVLFSSAGQSHDGFLNGSVPVVVVGDGAGALSTRVPSGTDVARGDSIAFPGVLGGVSEVVADIETTKDDSFKTLYLHMPLNIFTLRFVEIRHANTARRGLTD